MELDLQPGDVVKVLESAALGWVRARVIRVKSGGRVVVQSDQGREFTARGNQVPVSYTHLTLPTTPYV